MKGEGKVCHWFHADCLLEKQLLQTARAVKLRSVDEIAGFYDIRVEDQEDFEDKLEENVEQFEAILAAKAASPKKSPKKKKVAAKKTAKKETAKKETAKKETAKKKEGGGKKRKRAKKVPDSDGSASEKPSKTKKKKKLVKKRVKKRVKNDDGDHDDGASSSDPRVAELEGKTLDELKDMCEAKSLPTRGRKATLVSRLLNA